MELTEEQLLIRIGTSQENKTQICIYILKYLRILGVDKKISRLRNLDIYWRTLPEHFVGLGFACEITYNNGVRNIIAYDMLDNYKPIEDSKVANAIYELLCHASLTCYFLQHELW